VAAVRGLERQLLFKLSEEGAKTMVGDVNSKTAEETVSAIKEMGFVASSIQVAITKSLEVKMIEKTLKQFD
jgi:hypothetical protein